LQTNSEHAGKISRIVLTGGPASGKTDCFQRLQSVFELAGFAFLDELARRLLEDNPAYREDWPRFHREIYRRQLEREESLAGRSFISDRGTVDAFAFHPETMADMGTTLDKEYRRYTAVVQLGSTAGLGEPYYVRDHVRRESIEEALSIERALKNVWRGHPGYHFIEAEKNYEAKHDRVLALIEKLRNPDDNRQSQRHDRH
jgi:predicted ATPase